MKFKPEYAAFAIGAAGVMGWFLFQNFQSGRSMVLPSENVEQNASASPQTMEVSGSDTSSTVEQSKLSSSTELSAIEDDVNATVIYDENFSDLE